MIKRYVRMKEIVGSPKEGIPHIYPAKESTIWKMVKENRFPKAIKLSPRITVWRLDQIEELLERLERGGIGCEFVLKSKC